MNIIENLRAKRAEATDALDVLLATAVDESGQPRDFTEAENADFETLKKTVEQLDRQLDRAEAVRAMKAAAAVEIHVHPEDQPPAPRFAPELKSPEPKGAGFGRFVRCIYASKGSHRSAAQVAEEQFHDATMAKALSVGVAGDGGFLVPAQYSSDFIEFLRPASVVRASGAMTVSMPNGQLRMSVMSNGASASYIGESNHMPATQPTFSQIQMTARKLAALCPISNDLIRSADPSVDILVRNDLIKGIAQAEDAAFIRDIGTGNAPKGLRYWAANTPAMTATPNIAKITTDLATLETCLLNANIRMTTPGWIMAPRVANYLASLRDSTTSAYAFPEMAQGQLHGKPYRITTAVPVNLGGGTESEVYLADFAEVVIGETAGVMVDVFREGSYWNGAALVSAMDRDETIIRVILANDLAVRHTAAVAVLTGVTWGA